MNDTNKRNTDINAFVAQYRTQLFTYSRLGREMVDSLKPAIDAAGVPIADIDCRAKDPISVQLKIIRKNYTDFHNQLQDLVGVRVVTVYEPDVDRIIEIIKERFEQVVDFIDGDSGDKKTRLRTDQFGYRSSHLVVKIKKINVPPWVDYPHKYVEFQVRTTLQHGWADVSHSLDYKGSSFAPTELRRRLHAVAALLEIADNDFARMKKELADLEQLYEKAINDSKFEQIETDALSLSFYLKCPQFLATFPDGTADIQRRGKIAGMADWTAVQPGVLDGTALTRLALVAHELDLHKLSDLAQEIPRIELQLDVLLKEFMNELSSCQGEFHADPVDILTVAISMASRRNKIGRGLRAGFDWSGDRLSRPSPQVLSTLQRLMTK